MNRKIKIKIILDIVMTAALLFLMGYHLWGEAAHEWAGAGLLFLFVLHNFLNANWYRNLFRGRYQAFRCLQLVLNLLLLICMALLMYSGIVLSRYAFSFLQIKGGLSLARLLHMAGAYWGLVLMALHLGLHWNMLLSMGLRASGKKEGRGGRIAGVVCGTIIALYGLYALMKRELLTYMFVRREFVFLDYEESPVFFYLDYLAIMGLFIFIMHYVGKAIRLAQGKKKAKELQVEKTKGAEAE
ncbi:MAG: DUF4405 domain-containing protein [Clostridium sp.]|nr:DUF4405 domain-containing protein [Clostridium sp.]